MAVYSTTSGSMPTLWQKDIIAQVKPKTMINRYGNTKAISKNKAEKYILNRVLMPTLNTTASNYETVIAAAAARDFTVDKVEVTPLLLKDAFRVSDRVNWMSQVEDPEWKKVFTNHNAFSNEKYFTRRVVLGGMWHRIDEDPSYQFTGTADSGTTTTLVDNALTGADDYITGGNITFISPYGRNFDFACPITDFVASSDTATISVFQAPDTTSRYRIVVPTGITDTDVMTLAGFRRVRGLMQESMAMPFSDGQPYAMLVTPQQFNDLLNDQQFQDIITYSKPQQIESYTIYPVYDFAIIVNHLCPRMDTSGTFTDTGAVHCAVGLSKESFAISPWGLPNKDGFGVEYNFVNGPDRVDVSNTFSYMSWTTHAALQVTRATHTPILLTGATASQGVQWLS